METHAALRRGRRSEEGARQGASPEAAGDAKGGSMIKMLSGVWALLLGIVLIMLGNGMHFTLVGLRGGIEGFSAMELAIVTSGYFLGFLSGARLTPVLIQRVVHVRLRRARKFHVGRADRPSVADRTLGLDASARSDRFLHVGHLRCRRELAERRLHQRDARQGAVGLHDRADAGHHRGAGAAHAGGRRDLGAVHRRLDPRVDLIRPDPPVRRHRSGGRGRAPDATARPVVKLPARGRRGTLLLGRRLRHAIGHGCGLRNADRPDRRPDRAFRRDAVRRGACSAIPDRLALGQDGPAQADLRCGRARRGGLRGGLGLRRRALVVDGGRILRRRGDDAALRPVSRLRQPLSAEDMPAASGGLVFTFGLGAILGPLATGWAMEGLGPFAFWLVLGATFVVIALYALYRMTQRAVVPVDQTESYLKVSAHGLAGGGGGGGRLVRRTGGDLL